MVRLTPNPVVYMCIIKHFLSDPEYLQHTAVICNVLFHDARFPDWFIFFGIERRTTLQEQEEFIRRLPVKMYKIL